VQNLSWHWLFWGARGPTVVIAALAYLWIPPSPIRSPARINWVSAALMSAGISGVLIAVSEASTWGWASGRTIGLALAGLAVCAAWIAWEVRSSVALVDMRLMRLRPVWTTNLTAALLGGGMYAIFLIVPEFVQEPRSTGYGLGASTVQAGLYLLPLSLLVLLMSLQAGRIAARFGSRAALVAGTFATGMSFVLLLVAHTRPWHFYAASTVFGLGIGLSFSALGNLIVEAVPRTHTGVASGMNAVMRTLGGAVGAAFVATFIAGDVHQGQPALGGFLLALGVSAALLGLALLAALLIPGRRSSPDAAEPAIAAEVARPAAAEATL
jgi:predicted MFS family arabinose efflux permease